MPGYRSRSQYAAPVWFADDDGNALGTTAAPLAISGGGGSVSPNTADRSGTITTGGTAQQLAAANASRMFLKGQNLSSGDLWINESTGTATSAAAAQPSYRIPAGATFNVSTNKLISIWGATTGQAFSATEG